MKYFTPELYLQYNSKDDNLADLADEAWETAIRTYQGSLDAFRNSIPPRVVELVDGSPLHDAELISFQADLPSPIPEVLVSPMTAAMALKCNQQIVNIDYILWDAVAQSSPYQSWPFSSARVHWLYDEVGLEGSESNGRQRFWHRILFSNGRIAKIPFVDVIISRFSPEPHLVTRSWR